MVVVPLVVDDTVCTYEFMGTSAFASCVHLVIELVEDTLITVLGVEGLMEFLIVRAVAEPAAHFILALVRFVVESPAPPALRHWRALLERSERAEAAEGR